MTCKEVKNNLIFYHYGELDPQQSKAIREHLATCQSCAQAYAKLAQVLDYANTEAQTEPNPFIWTRIKAKLHEQQAINPAPIWQKILNQAIVVALIAIGIFLGIKLGQIYTQPTKLKTSEYNINLDQTLFISYNDLDNTVFLYDQTNALNP